MGGATINPDLVLADDSISIHAPRGGATSKDVRHVSKIPFQSTLPVGGATLFGIPGFPDAVISIHAPRGGSDSEVDFFGNFKRDFNPRSPWGERLFIKYVIPSSK